jgi:hypothetical protein
MVWLIIRGKKTVPRKRCVRLCRIFPATANGAGIKPPCKAQDELCICRFAANNHGSSRFTAFAMGSDDTVFHDLIFPI